MEPIPFEVKEQIIQCFGRCFHYKDNLESFLRSAGIDKILAAKYRDEYKFVWGKKLLNDLENEDGRILQRKILTELCKLRNLPDSEVKDKSAGLDALRTLKELTVKYQIIIEEKKTETVSRKVIAENKLKIAEERNLKLNGLALKFNLGINEINRQKSGFDLESILNELFSLSEIEYKKSYKTNTQQIDGYFRFESFDYLVEAKWRSDQPTEGEIGEFQRKVRTKLESTRGLFVSVAGFRGEVIQQYSGEGANIIFMTGEDLIHILEGRIHLKEALTVKIERAVQYGEVYFKIL